MEMVVSLLVVFIAVGPIREIHPLLLLSGPISKGGEKSNPDRNVEHPNTFILNELMLMAVPASCNLMSFRWYATIFDRN